jgi:hypothetical protein
MLVAACDAPPSGTLPPDTLHVLETIPSAPDGGRGEHPIGPPLRVRFDRLLAPSTIDRAQLRVTTGGLQAFGGIRYDVLRRELSLFVNPNDLRPGLEYVLTVDTGLRGWDGSALEAPVVVRFRPTAREPVEAEAVPSLRRDVAPIFASSCAGGGCHGGDDPAMGLDLRSPAAIRATSLGVMARQRGDRAALENLDPRWSALPRIDPGIVSGRGRPEYSYLVYKLLGEGPIWGARMPLRGAPLSDDEMRLVLDWVSAGAPDN